VEVVLLGLVVEIAMVVIGHVDAAVPAAATPKRANLSTPC
jgi:hypothetical protein